MNSLPTLATLPNMPLPYSYDPGVHRRKHCQAAGPATFIKMGSITIGKCPSALTKQHAEELLQNGFAYPPGLPEGAHPDKVYNVFEGVIYEAVPTMPGRSYHGYPWCFLPGRARIPECIFEALKARAKVEGFEREFKHWTKEHGWK
ncbi:hypothetical protein [Paraburkholderia tropica]|uniref:hypothetical protein n=1 Tax=Paraburkholderia tropica TaxID=92647 RepID=UPI002AB6223D|nr:hypothetical protein [Paraburkholderia tropica]